MRSLSPVREADGQYHACIEISIGDGSLQMRLGYGGLKIKQGAVFRGYGCRVHLVSISMIFPTPNAVKSSLYSFLKAFITWSPVQ